MFGLRSVRAYPLSAKSKAGSKFLFYRASLPESRFALFRTHFSVRANAVLLAAMALAFAAIASGAEAQDGGKPRLGVSLRDLSPDTAYELGVPIPGGLEVGTVSAGSPAKAAGMLPGDIIIMVDGRKVLDTPALMDGMDRVRPGKPVQISVLREGRLLQLSVMPWGPPQAAPAPMPETRQARAAPVPKPEPRQAKTPHAPEAGKAWLGVSTANLTPEEAAELRLDKPSGAKVTSVAKDSPLGEMGVQSGDVIVKLDGRPVADSNALDTLLAGKRPGTRVMLSYVREGNTRYLAIKLAQRPEAAVDAPKEADAEPAPEPAPAPAASPVDAEKPQETEDRREPAGDTLFGAPAGGERNRLP